MALAPATLSLSESNFLEQVKYAIIAIAGNEVTKGKANRDSGLLIYQVAHRFVLENRFNIVFSTQIEQFANFFGTKFVLKALNDRMSAQLKDLFPIVPLDGDIKKTDSIFADVKAFCRNHYGALYVKDRKKYKSGEYSDLNILKFIWKEAVISRINENNRKALGDHIAKEKKRLFYEENRIANE